MSSYDELKEKFDSGVKELRETCTHQELTDWCDEWWAIAHSTGYQVRSCKVCSEIIHRKITCHICNKTIQDDEIHRGDGKRTLAGPAYCKECFDKGDPWCLEMSKELERAEKVEVII